MKYLLLACLFLSLLSCNDSSENASEEIITEEITFTKEGELKVYKSDGSIIPLNIEFAETSYETSTGLMYRDSMEEDQGMLFIFSFPSIHNFYMKNTEIPLDIIYIKANNKIATIAANAEPFSEQSLSSKVPVQYVLEINGGLTEDWNIKVGDSISYTKD
ncbi:MAG: DUF192 domain-containing protein [Leeuwenhoekiella sp.]